MLRKLTQLIVATTLFALVAITTNAAPPEHARNNARAIERLQAESGGTAVRVSSATDTATFVRLPPGLAAKTGATTAKQKDDAAVAFISKHAEAFGLRVGSNDLKLLKAERDSLGQSHLSYVQEYAGLPVFGAALKVHFDANDQLAAVTGTLVPDIAVSVAPSRSAAEAGATAVQWVNFKDDSADLSVRGTQLLIFREGLAKGVPGANHLAYGVEVGNGTTVREFVYVDAHSGKVIDQISGTTDALNRRAYDAEGQTAPGPHYPDDPYWVEGDALPTADAEADNMIIASQETYDLFANAFGRDSFDGAGATMDSIFNRGNGCPNASWNGTFISFCPGLTTDDVTGHEWAHAYTEYTDNLIYQWQPGALNEAASDIFGETLDRINGRDIVGVGMNDARTAGSCSVFTTLPPTVTINSPAAIAGVKPAGTAAFGPQTVALTGDVVQVDDGANVGNDGCETPFVNAAAVAGNIAFMDRGACGFVVKAKNAQLNGAVGVIIGNNQGGTAIVNMAGADATVTIPSLSVTQNDGTAIKAELASTVVNATLSRGEVGSDQSARWLVGEDSTAPGLVGALRDMWTPSCYGDPGKVSDPLYACGTGDGGGVHSNSGVDNHAYALMVDGGSYNGQSMTGIGLTKAAHVYFRAKTHYQGPATDFAAHADALELSCADLTGTNLASLTDGTPSGEIVSAADCEQVAKAILAVEMRTPPTQCGFEPLLAQDPPPLCDSPTKSSKVLFTDGFENGNSSLARWQRSHDAVSPDDFTERDWVVTGNLPGERAGRAFFGIDPGYGTCAAGGDESSVLHLDSPQIAIPASTKNLRMAFDHWVATEDGFDGGNVKISVNGGEWIVVDPADFVYNPYNINSWGVNFIPGLPFTTNPIGWEAGHFSGTDGGSVLGTWGRSIIDLAPYAQPEDKIQLRFDFGTDGCGGVFGWYVDDVSVYECR